MQAVGIITEYNPFHNGHIYHIQQAKKLTGADVVVAVMSGNFVQRGEPALFDKWQRTQMALENGVDLVIELPTFFAVQPSHIFADGAIQLLSALGVILYLAVSIQRLIFYPLNSTNYCRRTRI